MDSEKAKFPNEKPPPYTIEDGIDNLGYQNGGEGVPTKKGKMAMETRVEDDEEEVDPWDMPELKDTETPWNELDGKGKFLRVFFIIFKIILFLGFLYLFICSLDFLSSAFKLLGGQAAGNVFRDNELLRNPVCGVMIGVLATVLVQSSSTTTSVVVAMVGAKGLLDVRTAIPIVMGANIGTSVTNTIVSIGQITQKNDFRRAFAGATVHDMFNWMTVIILLPVEVITGYLFKLSEKIVDSLELQKYADGKQELLKAITKPFTKKIVEVDSKGIQKVAKGEEVTSLLKTCCKKVTHYYEVYPNGTRFEIGEEVATGNGTFSNTTNIETQTTTKCTSPCKYDYLFQDRGLSDSAVGAILLVVALIILCVCLFAIVKTLNSLLKGNIRKGIKKFVNADFPGKVCGYFTGYLAILVGTGLTILVQSSSIFTSTLTPLVGVGVISIQRMYPLTLGANIGTTTTGILASLATDDIRDGLQVALCHLFFNLSGILLFYPIPFMRFPIPLSKFLGNETAKYRWFALAYLVAMFFVFPLIVFGLSIAGWYVLAAVGIPILVFIIVIGIIKTIQKKRPRCLPAKLQNWKFLPICCRSLEPIDRLCVCCKCCRHEKQQVKNDAKQARTEVELSHL